MEPEAIRPDRDVIGKQKNPRKRKMKRESSSLPSPGGADHINYMDHGDMLLSYIVDIEMKHHNAQIQNSFNSPIGINHSFVRIKPDPDSNTYSLLSSPAILNSLRVSMPGEPGRIATVEQFNHAMRSYVLLAVDWVNSLFELAQIENTSEKMIMLRNAFGAFCTFHKATTTAQMASDEDTIVLCNGSLIPRCLPRHLFEMQFFANNIIGKLIDEVVVPYRRFMVNETERAALTALIFLDGDFKGMSEQTAIQLNLVKERVQLALFQAIRDRTSSVSSAANRFAGLLLTLPGVTKLSTLYAENVQMAKMFGAQQMDRFVIEVVTNTPATPEPPSPSKNKLDAETQTNRFTESEELGRIGNELVALGLDLSANPPMTVPEMSSGSSSNSPHAISPPGPSISSSSSSLASSSMNKPPPLVVNPSLHQQMPGSSVSSHHNSPVAASAPVYPFYYNGYPDQMNQFNNYVHSNGIQSAGPFQQPSFFNHQSQSGNVDYHQQNCFKF